MKVAADGRARAIDAKDAKGKQKERKEELGNVTRRPGCISLFQWICSPLRSFLLFFASFASMAFGP
jgi:hypothetical protein